MVSPMVRFPSYGTTGESDQPERKHSLTARLSQLAVVKAGPAATAAMSKKRRRSRRRSSRIVAARSAFWCWWWCPRIKRPEWLDWRKIITLLLPHLALLLANVVYTCIGAYIFIKLEGDHWNQLHNETETNITSYQKQLISEIRTLIDSGKRPEDGIPAFEDFTSKLHQMVDSKTRLVAVPRGSELTTRTYYLRSLTFRRAAFYVLSAAATIGYGDVAPLTEDGRIFTLLYGTLGFPLILFFITDIAKFLSDSLTSLYTKYLECKGRLFMLLLRLIKKEELHSPQTPDSDLDRDEEATADQLWAQLEQSHYVRIPPLLILILIAGYAAFGGWLLQQYEDGWSFFDGMYFSQISILKIGFGDIVPENSFFVPVLYIAIGLVITTMSVDAVGVHYLHRIHYLGRQIGQADYLYLLQKAKRKKKKREAMKSLMNTLMFAKHMKVEMKRSASLHEAPEAVETVYVLDVSPYSILLGWEPDMRATSYVVRHRIRQRKGAVVEVGDIQGIQYEIRGLQSFSIYEIDVLAVNKYGTSPPTHLVQITEPETAPQNIHVELLSATTIKVRWMPPLKKKKDVRKYSVYYTDDPSAPYSKWSKLFSEPPVNSIVLDELQEDTTYTICIAAVWGAGHSPFSRSICSKTGRHAPDAERLWDGGLIIENEAVVRNSILLH